MNDPMCPTCFEVPATMLPDARVALLMRISQQALSNPRVREIARQLRSTLTDRLGRSPTQGEMVQWLADAGHLLTEYKPDPPGEEVFQSVEYTLGGGASRQKSPITGRAKGVGDCEDLAGMFVALALALGIPARVQWWSQPGAPLNHVAAKAKIGNEWVNVETTIPGAHVGETPYQALDRIGPDYRSRIFGLREAAGGVFAPAGDPLDFDFAVVGEAGPASGNLYLLNLPPGSVVRIDGVPVPGVAGVYTEFSSHGQIGYGFERRPERPAWIVRMSAGDHTVDVQPLNRSWSVTMPTNGIGGRDPEVLIDVNVEQVTLIAESQTPVPAAQLRVVNMPPGGVVTIDGRVMTGTWLDMSYTVWVVNSTVGPHAVQVRFPDGAARSVQVTIPPGGTSINANDMTAVPDASSDTTGTVTEGALVTTLRVFSMPHGGSVQIDGVDTDGRWTDTDYVEWDVPITTGTRTVRIVAADGTARAQSVDVTAEGATVNYDEMSAAGASTGGASTGGGRGRGRMTRSGRTRSNDDRVAVADSSPSALSPVVLPGVQRQGGTPVPTATLGLVHMPPYGSVFVDGAQADGGAWDATQTTWYITVAPGRHEVRVVAPANAWTRTLTVDVPAAGTTVDVAQVQTAPPVATLATLGLVRMPPYGSVFVDGAQVHVGSWDATQTTWSISVAPGRHEVRVVAPANAWTRSVTVDVPAAGASVDVGQVDATGTDKQPSPPTADATTVELTLHADNCGGFTLVTLRGANGSVVSTMHETIVGSVIPRGSDLGPLGADPARPCMENWRTSVPPGTYTVRGVLRNGRDGTAQIIVPTTAASQVVSMTDLNWTWAPAGQVIVHSVPQVPAPDLTSLTRSDRTVYTVTLTPPGGDAESSVSLPRDGVDFVGYVAPGPYTLRVIETVGSTPRVYYSQSVNVRADQTTEVYAVAPHADTAPPASSGMSSVRLVGLPVNWTFTMGNAVSTAMPVPTTFQADSTGPAESVRIAPTITTRTVAGSTLSYGEVPVVTLPIGTGVATITSPRGVSVHMPIVVDAPAESVDVSYDVERALRYASALRGITGVQPINGARVGYLADDADVITRQLGLRGTANAPLGEVVEFQALGTQPDAFGRLPTVIFVKDRGLQLAWITAKELQRVRNQIQFLRTHLQPDATYPYEIGQQ